MNLLLVNLPVREDLPPNTPNLGLAYVAGSLRDHDHRVEVLDLNGCRFSRDQVEALVSDPDMKSFDAVLVSAMIAQFGYARWFLDLCRQKGLKTALGGSLASSCPELMIRFACTVIVGEGENFDPVRHRNGIFHPPEVEDIELVPVPALDLFPMEKYLSNPVGGAVNKDKWASGRGERGQRSLLILSSRGCPNNCIFCHHDYLGFKPRYRSAGSILDEIELWRGRYGINSFSFADDNFTANRERLLEFCRGLKPDGLNWGCAARLDALGDPSVIRAMKQAGCVHVGFGLESASAPILAGIKKGIDPRQMRVGIGNLIREGMDFDYTLIIGLPGETNETLEETIRFCKTVCARPPENIFFATAYPGTGLWNRRLGFLVDGGLRLQVNPATFFHLSNDAMYPDRLEKYLSALGENDERMIINFSNMDDSELMAAMERARRELRVRDRSARQPRRVVL